MAWNSSIPTAAALARGVGGRCRRSVAAAAGPLGCDRRHAAVQSAVDSLHQSADLRTGELAPGLLYKAIDITTEVKLEEEA